MVPLPFRARGSLCFAKPSIDFMKEHHDACKEDGFDLWFCVESLKEMLKAESLDVNAVSQPLFKEFILECFGRDEELATIFTTEIMKVLQMSKHGGVTKAVENYIRLKSRGLWSKLPAAVDKAKVNQAFEKFAEGVEGLSPRLTDHSTLVKYLLLICPSLNLDDDEEEESEGENSNEDEAQESDADDAAGQESENESVEVVEDGDESTKGQGGKELGKNTSDEGGQSDSDSKVESNKTTQAVRSTRPRGKELRRKTAAGADQSDDDSEEEHGEESNDEEEAIKIGRASQRGKELRKRSGNRPVYNEQSDDDENDSVVEDSSEDGNDGDDGESYREEPMANGDENSAQGSNPDDLQDDDLMEAEDGDDQSEDMVE